MALRLPKTKGMLRREAAAWLARLQSGRDPAIEPKFRRWSEAHPSHSAAFERVRRSYEQAGLLRYSASSEGSGTSPAAEASQARLATGGWLALAATVALAFLLVYILSPQRPSLFGGEQLMYSTTVGEIREVELSDGTRVTLDTATRLAVEVGRSGRRATLSRGRARFDIKAGDAPFVVDSAAMTVSAREGIVDVSLEQPDGKVEVLSGKADVRRRIAGSSASSTLVAGQALSGSGPEVEEYHIAGGRDWPSGMLQFDGTPLGEALEIANRYSTRQLLAGDGLSQLKVTGAFRAGDTAGLARALAAAFGLDLTAGPDGSLLLSRKKPPAEQKKKGG